MPRQRLRAGDILITRGAPAGHAGIALFSLDVLEGVMPLPDIRAHVAQQGAAPFAHLVHHAVTPDGVVQRMGWHQASTVFRPVGIGMPMLERMVHIATEIGVGARYGLARAVLKSWSGSTRFSSQARDRLAKYRERFMNHQGRVAIVKNVYCSEFVILVYQLAALSEEDPHFIRLNAKHVLPPELKRWLDHHPTRWQRVGTTTGDDSLEFDPL